MTSRPVYDTPLDYPTTTNAASQDMHSPVSASTSPFLPTLLSSKLALITGGASGIGLEIARQIAAHQATVVLMGRRQAVLDRAIETLSSQGYRAVAVQGDVRSADDARRVVESVKNQFGRLDVLVNCAAGNFLTAAEVLSTNGFRTVIDIDTIGTFNMSSACFQLLRQSHGCIINISATLHRYATWYQVHASAAKAAVDSLTRSLALEWGEYGIRVNGVAPGSIADTPGLSKLGGEMKDKDEERQFIKQIPLGRLGTKQDVAQTCVFLASTAASYISGQTIVVDGAALLYREPIANRQQITAFARAVEKKSRESGVAKDKMKSKL